MSVAVREGIVEGVTVVGEKSGMLVSEYVPVGSLILGGVSPPRQEANGRISNAAMERLLDIGFLFIGSCTFLPTPPHNGEGREGSFFQFGYSTSTPIVRHDHLDLFSDLVSEVIRRRHNDRVLPAILVIPLF
jgi:hypothetical protein